MSSYSVDILKKLKSEGAHSSYLSKDEFSANETKWMLLFTCEACNAILREDVSHGP